MSVPCVAGDFFWTKAEPATPNSKCDVLSLVIARLDFIIVINCLRYSYSIVSMSIVFNDMLCNQAMLGWRWDCEYRRPSLNERYFNKSSSHTSEKALTSAPMPANSGNRR